MVVILFLDYVVLGSCIIGIILLIILILTPIAYLNYGQSFLRSPYRYDLDFSVVWLSNF
jgi:hypothetical protein